MTTMAMKMEQAILRFSVRPTESGGHAVVDKDGKPVSAWLDQEKAQAFALLRAGAGASMSLKSAGGIR